METRTATGSRGDAFLNSRRANERVGDAVGDAVDS